CSVETDSRLIRPGFPDVELHQGTRVQIQDQRRSSTTASDTDEPRTRGALSRPSGLPPDHASRPLFASVRTTTSSSPSGLAGTMTATALFRSVTVTVSPRCTRASVALNLSLSSRTPIRVFAMASPGKWPHISTMWPSVQSGVPGTEPAGCAFAERDDRTLRDP